jgi:hypothetical protein
MDNVIDAAEKAIDEIVPRARFVVQTTLQQRAIDGR